MKTNDTKKTERTEGNWKHLEPDQVRGPEGEFVADCCSNVPGRSKRDRANAMMIASAPKLLKALKGCVGFLQDMADDYAEYGVPEMAAKVRAAIAKAEGRTL